MRSCFGVAMQKERKYSIGRDRSCDIPIADESVSRKHAEIAFDLGKILVTDCGSSNGTTLIRQGAPRPLKQEYVFTTDQIRFGDITLSVKDLLEAIRAKDSPAAAKPAPNKEVAKAAAAVPGKVVRCACGAVKRTGEFCPACGQGE